MSAFLSSTVREMVFDETKPMYPRNNYLLLSTNHKFWKILTITFVWLSLTFCDASIEWDNWNAPTRGLPLIQSFSLPPARHRGEVWSFASEASGELWVGSDELFHFDGEDFHRIELPFETYAIRALTHDESGKLWIGSIGEIGHLEMTASGVYEYISVRNKLEKLNIDKVRVWDAVSDENGVFFILDDRILRWQNNEFEQWEIPGKGLLRATIDNGNVWISRSEGGIYRIGPEKPELVISPEEIPNGLASWALGSVVSRDGSVYPAMIGTESGVLKRVDDHWEKLQVLSEAIRDASAWKAVMLDNDTVSIGTALKGVVIATMEGEIIAKINRSNGLPNEFITGLWYDHENELLWIGYVGGMSWVEMNGNSSLFNARNGLDEMPASKTFRHHEDIYVLTRLGLSTIKPRSNGESSVDQYIKASTPLADALSTENNLWLGGFYSGLSRAFNSQVHHETDVEGFLHSLTEVNEPGIELIYSQDSKLFGLQENKTDPQSWESILLYPDLGSVAISTIVSDTGEYWVSTVSDGIIRFEMDATGCDPEMHLIHRYNTEDGLPHILKRPFLTSIDNQIFLLSEIGVLRYEKSTDSFAYLDELKGFTPIAFTQGANNSEGYWIVQHEDFNVSGENTAGLIKVQSSNGSSFDWTPLDAPGLSSVGRIAQMNYTAGKHPALWISGTDALLCMTPSYKGHIPPIPPDPISLSGIERNGIRQPLPTNGDDIRFDAGTRQLKFYLKGIKIPDGQTRFVQGSLTGVFDNWSKPQIQPSFEYAGLSPGTYKFRARTLDYYNRPGPVFTTSFTVAPPWYQSPLAYFAYIVLIAISLIIGIRWRMRWLHDANKRLNKLVATRTSELAQANIARNEFLETISHEIRNPLNGIKNLVDLLKNTKLEPTAKKLAESLGLSAAHLNQVFGDVLGFTKLEYGHTSIQEKPISLVDVLNDIVTVYSLRAKEQNSELSLMQQEGFLDGFKSDSEMIKTIIRNYVGNALKYAPGKSIEISIKSNSNNPEDPSVNIWIGVKDQGPGIAEEDQMNLFVKFGRGKNAKELGIPGTGLGLSICRGTAQLLDGKVGVESVEGQGSTFWLEIPLQRSLLPKKSPAQSEASFDHPDGREGHALVVDDQEYNQAVLSGIAHHLGYTYKVASNGDEVWPLIESQQFDLVLLDWELPGMNGSEIASRLRRHRNTHTSVIIATTAHDSRDIIRKCISSGMDGFAAKPYDRERIRLLINNARNLPQRLDKPTESLPSPKSLQNKEITLQAFQDFAIGNPHKAKEAVSSYLEVLRTEINNLEQAVKDLDNKAAAKAAHILRSHAGLVNDSSLNESAQKMVTATRNTSNEDWTESLNEIKTDVEKLAITVESMAQRSGLWNAGE